MRRAAFTFAVLLISAALSAQAPPVQPPQPPVFRAGVDVIEVDVSIVDDRGRPISDMLAPEFTVTVDGRPRKVLSAQFVSLRPAAGDKRRPSEPVIEPLYSSNVTAARGRLIVIAVDRDSISLGEGRHAMHAAGRFLDTLGPADKVAFFTVPLSGPIVDFTANHQLVRKELERAAGMARRPRGTLNLGVFEAFAVDQHSNPHTEAVALERFCGQFRPGTPQAEACELEVRGQAATIVAELRQRTDASVRALESVLQALGDVEGPKSLVWISEGLVIDGPGAELASLERLAAAGRVTVNVIMLDAPFADVSERELSPSAREDRDLQMRGLEMLAGYTRGAIFPVGGSADAVFQRLEEELSGYYMLGVESTPADGDGRRHGIKVSVRRRGANVRARREFVIGSRTAKNETLDERLQRLLRSPFASSDLPLRLATYAFRDTTSGKVRVVVATEIANGEKAAADVAIGFALIDRDGKVAASGVQRATRALAEGARGPVLEHLGALSVDPGSYTLRLAAIDGDGRRGSIEHPTQAWQMSNVPFAVGDLVVADAPAKAGDPLRPSVEPRLASGRLGAYLELYADPPAALEEAQVRIEIAADETSAALASGAGVVSPTGDPTSRAVSAVVPVAALPPGHYVARAIVTRGAQKVGQLVRPLQIAAVRRAAAGPEAAAGGASAAATTTIATMLSGPSAFRRDDLVKGEVLGFFLDALDRDRPALKATTAQVRSGNFVGAARQAFDAGDQLAAMFLRGLELLAANDLNKAAQQFDAALRLAPEFSPAAFYLGACFATAGRDREAATSWRRALSGRDQAPMQYASLGDALFRLGQGPDALAILRDGVAAWPEDAQLRRRLAIAYTLAGQHADALAAIEPYLAKTSTDHEALLVAVHAIYATHLEGRAVSNVERDRERMAVFARAYAAAKGPHAQLVAAWAGFVAKQ